MTDQGITSEAALESWKAIAAYLNRDVRTAKRWEKTEGLPVRRHLHQVRSSVYAYPSELDAWRASRLPSLSADPLPRRSRVLHRVVFAVALVLALATSQSGPPARLGAAQQTGPSLTQIFSEQLAIELNGDARLSPDGKRLAAVDTGRLVVVDTMSEQRTQLTATNWDEAPYGFAESPVWSPDGRQIAYGWFIDGRYELRVMPASGGTPRVLFRAESFLPADWSPDGAYITGTLWRRDGTTSLALVSEAGALTELRGVRGVAPSHSRFSPDGRLLAYSADVDGRGRVLIFDLATKSEVELTPPAITDRLPVWSRDGAELLYMSDRTGRADLWALPIRDGRPAGEGAVAYADLGGIRAISGWTADGALVMTRPVSFGHLYRVAVDTTSGATLTPPQRPVAQFHGKHMQASWSPDGSELALLTQTRERGAIYIVTPSTGDVRELQTRDIGFTRIAGWLPGGDGLLISSAHDTRSLFLFRPRDGSREEIFSDRTLNWASVQLAPDGTRFAASFGNTLRVIDLKDKRVIREFSDGDPAGFNGFSFVPDGSAVYAIVGRRIMRVPVSSGPPQEIHAGLLYRSIAVSPDGRTVAFTVLDPSNSERYHLYVVDALGGEPHRVRLPDGHMPWRVQWDPQGRLSYISFEVKSQFLRLTDFLPRG